jgi:hypothetical protein
MVLRCLCSIKGADRQIIEIELVLGIMGEGKGSKSTSFIEMRFLGRLGVDDVGDLPRCVALLLLLLSFMLASLLLRVKLSKMALVSSIAKK